MTARSPAARPDLPPSRPHWRERDDLTLDAIEDLVQEGAFTAYDRLELSTLSVQPDTQLSPMLQPWFTV